MGRGLVGLEQRPRAAVPGGIDRIEPRPEGGVVVARLKVDGFLDPLTVGFGEAIEAALALAPGVTGLDQPGDQRELAVDLMEGIVGRQRRAQAGCDVRQEVDPDQVGKSKNPGLGDAERAAHDQVRRLDRQADLERLAERRLHPVAADPVGDEAGRVLARDHALAEPAVGERRDRSDRLGPGVRPGDHLEQAHVAGRVEEMGDQEVAAEACRQAVGELGERQGRGVGGDHGARLADPVELAVEGALDVQLLDHRLDDPVDLAKTLQIVLEIAGGHQPRRLPAHEGRRIGLGHALERAARERVPIGGAGRHDVEQQDRDAGVGDLGGDAGAHDPGADHRRPLDRHQIASSTVAIPWPPPMHWVARPKRRPSRFMSAAVLPVIRAPVAPSGWPSAKRTAVEVEGPLVDPEIAHAGERLRSERLIELDHLDVADLEPGAGQRFPRRGDRPDAHDLGGAAGDRDAPDAGQHVEPVLVGVILGADQHRGRPVGQRRGGAGGHRAMLVERGLEVGERRLAGLRADAAVGLDRPAVAPDRHDLGRELASSLRRCGLAVAQGRERLLGATGDLILPGDVLGGHAHAVVGLGVVGDQLGARERVVAADRHPGHRFDPGADEHLAGVELDRARRHVDRLHRGAAEAVDRGAGDRDRQMREQCHQARHVHALLALGKRAADDHVLDVGGLDPASRNQRRDHLGGQLVRADFGQRALVREMERRAGVAGDHDVLVHGSVPIDGWQRQGRSPRR